jgi:hypothetical protein
MQANGRLHVPVDLPPENTGLNPLNRRLSGRQTGWEKWKSESNRGRSARRPVLSLRRPGFNPRSIYMGFMLDKVAVELFPLSTFSPANSHYTKSPCLSFIIRGWYSGPVCSLSTKGLSSTYRNNNNNVTFWVCGYRRGMDWWMDLLTTCTHHSELQVITAPSLISTLYKLSPCSWALLEKPPVAQLLKNFPAFYGTRRFITVFTRALHWSLSRARWIQSIPPYAISLRSILISRSHLRLGLTSYLFPSGFPTNILYTFLFSPTRSTFPARLIIRDLSILMIFAE